jgi:hypothetical protein
MAVLPIVIEMLTTKREANNDIHSLSGNFCPAVTPFGVSTSLKKYHPLFFFNHLKTMMV